MSPSVPQDNTGLPHPEDSSSLPPPQRDLWGLVGASSGLLHWLVPGLGLVLGFSLPQFPVSRSQVKGSLIRPPWLGGVMAVCGDGRGVSSGSGQAMCFAGELPELETQSHAPRPPLLSLASQPDPSTKAGARLPETFLCHRHVGICLDQKCWKPSAKGDTERRHVGLLRQEMAHPQRVGRRERDTAGHRAQARGIPRPAGRSLPTWPRHQPAE